VRGWDVAASFLVPPLSKDVSMESGARGGTDELATCLTERLGRFVAIARSMLGNEQDVEDVVQDVATRAITARGSFRGDADICTWVHRILVNRCNDVIASRVRRRNAIAEDAFDELWDDPRYTVDPTGVEAAVADREELADALARLTPAQRSVVTLHDAQGWKLREIADVLDAPLPTVKSHLRRGRRALVTLLGGASE
jgi:RNA polymerase sigma-70 factor, ECF subfamily